MVNKAAGFLTDRLTSRWLPVYLAIIAIVLFLPSLWVGWQLDDYFQRLMMLGTGYSFYSPWDVYSLFRGNPENVRICLNDGVIPWWTPHDFQLAFFRYLSAFFLWLDYRLWPENPALMHTHSLFWLAGLVLATGLFFRGIMGLTWVAGMAALLYAIDDARALPVAWIANRNALLSAFFGVCSLLTYDKWRKDAWRKGAFLSPLCLALGLLSGEIAVAGMGYLCAYAVYIERDQWQVRVKALIPNLCIVLLWTVIYRIFKFGAHGSGYYFDPTDNPMGFIRIFAERAPLLLLGQFSFLSADTVLMIPDKLINPLRLVSLGHLVLVIFFMVPLILKNRVAKFWTLGMLLSLVPITAVFPANRLLLFTGLGAAGLMAQFFAGLRGKSEWLPNSRSWQVLAKCMAVYLVIVHLVAAPLTAPVLAYSVKTFCESMVTAIESVPEDQEIAKQTLVIVNAPDYLIYVSNIPTLKILEHKPFPKYLRALTTGTNPVKISRIATHTIQVEIKGGLYSGPLGYLFRSPDDPMKTGDEINITGMTARIAGVNDKGTPDKIMFSFDVPLEDYSLRWLQWDDGKYIPFEIPREGQSVELSAAYSIFDVMRKHYAEE